MQLPTVAFRASGSQAADIAAETEWCGDFSKHQTLVRNQAGDLAIQQAKAVGEVPLKVVAAPTCRRLHPKRSTPVAPALSARQIRVSRSQE